jgi:hypothetical protein
MTYAGPAHGYAKGGGELEQIQFLLGHVSIQTKEPAVPKCGQRPHWAGAEPAFVGGVRIVSASRFPKANSGQSCYHYPGE